MIDQDFYLLIDDLSFRKDIDIISKFRYNTYKITTGY